MKRRGFQWVWLFLGAVLISGTCGFGYEAKRTRTQFEEAKDAFGKQDWERVVENLSDTSDPGRPNPKAFAAFLHTYVDPELERSQYKLDHRETKSSFIPVKDEFIEYQRTGERRPPLLMLRYVDDAIWFDVPFSKRKMGVFRGKLINMSFPSCFFRLCRELNPEFDRRNSWRSVVVFLESEKGKLAEMGITPKNLYSKAKTWDEYIAEYKERIRKWQESRKT